MTGRFTSFEQFWPWYLREHSNPSCRALHLVGTTMAFGCLAMGLLRNPLWFAAALPVGYFLAWTGHFVFERNRPATFQYPLWSLRADLRMYRLFWTGHLTMELQRAGIHRGA